MLHRERSRPPCGWLVNDKPCQRSSSCNLDHNPYRIRQWKQWMQNPSKPCRNGEMCEFLTSGCCRYYHPPSHVRRDSLYNERSGGRDDLIRQNLKFLMNINVQNMGLEEDAPVRIEHVHAISSFNKIASNQIAVPGMYPLGSLLYPGREGAVLARSRRSI